MASERITYAKKNMLWGFVNKVITLLLPFTTRSLLIQYLGSEYLGLSGLFTSVLTVLNLTELGFSSAIVFSMYKPIAENNVSEVCALLNYYKNVYRKIGLAILGVGVVLIPFLPYFINGEHPADISLTPLYLIYLANTVVSYFLFAYSSSLLAAIQRNDIISNISTIINIVLYAMQIIVILVFHNFYCYAIILPVMTVVSNISTYIIARKVSPQYKCCGTISAERRKSIHKQVKGLMITKVQMISRNAFDNIFISAFLGLTISAIYSNYYYIMTAVAGFITIISSSLTAGIGNSVALESVEKNYTDMNLLNFIYLWMGGWCTVCLLCLYQPFMELWVGTALMFPLPIMILFCVYFYSLRMGDIRSIYMEVNGLWWENRNKAIIESIANLALNYLLGKYFGVYGILAATILTILVINFGYGSKIVFRCYFKKQKVTEYYLRNLFYAFVTFTAAISTYFLCDLIPVKGLAGLLIRGIVCCIVPNIVFMAFYCKTSEFKTTIPLVKHILLKK